MVKERLIDFEKRVADAFAAKKIRGPIHLSGGNEDHLIHIFKDIHPEDWVFSTYRSHYHALLHGIPEEWLWDEILAGRSMNIHNYEHRFFTSAIVGGALSIAVGVSASLKRQGVSRRVWCFLGDMASTIGAYHEAKRYAICSDLPIKFIVEDNGLSCNSPTEECWSTCEGANYDVEKRYGYERQHPHVGIEQWVQF